MLSYQELSKQLFFYLILCITFGNCWLLPDHVTLFVYHQLPTPPLPAYQNTIRLQTNLTNEKENVFIFPAYLPQRIEDSSLILIIFYILNRRQLFDIVSEFHRGYLYFIELCVFYADSIEDTFSLMTIENMHRPVIVSTKNYFTIPA